MDREKPDKTSGSFLSALIDVHLWLQFFYSLSKNRMAPQTCSYFRFDEDFTS